MFLSYEDAVMKSIVVLLLATTLLNSGGLLVRFIRISILSQPKQIWISTL